MIESFNPKEYSSQEKAEINKQRVLSDADLIKGGAEYGGEEGDQLIPTDEQIEAARAQMHAELQDALEDKKPTELPKESAPLKVEKENNPERILVDNLANVVKKFAADPNDLGGIESNEKQKHLEEFEEKVKSYYEMPGSLSFISLISAVEMLGKYRAEKDDPPEIRDCIDKMEAVLANKHGLKRIRLPKKWFDTNDFNENNLSDRQKENINLFREAYRTESKKIKGRSKDLAFRIVQPAYSDKDGNINNPGIVLITD